jgi:hypothetical protein
MPKQPKCLPGKEDHKYAPLFEIKLHPKNAWQSSENPLTHPKCKGHL